MRSMTGYGRGSAQADGREATIEIKTVNHRFLDVNLRAPRGMLYLEDPLRKAIAQRLSRGHADVYINYRNLREDAREVRVDLPLLLAYGRALDEMGRALYLKDDRSVTRLAQMPDVLSLSEKEEDAQAVTDVCLSALSEALDALSDMRQREGDTLLTDMLEKLDKLEDIRAAILARAPLVVTEYRERLEARIAELLSAPPDPQRLAQEVALLADRAAIDEELVRLASHIAQAREHANLPEPVGRKLDFIVQEMGREVNTIGSKASDLQVTGLVLAAKAEIEKMREQVQNIE